MVLVRVGLREKRTSSSGLVIPYDVAIYRYVALSMSPEVTNVGRRNKTDTRLVIDPRVLWAR